MSNLIAWIAAHWVTILAAATSAWIFIRESFNKIANALPAPTKDSTERYRWWFRFVNNMAGNSERADNHSIESSPNFVPAAEAYMQKKLAEQAASKPS
jgi:uncharacterized protein (DUF1697 family)